VPEGKSGIVTGAGAASARRRPDCGQHKAMVAVNDYDRGRAEAVASHIGPQALAIAGDVTSPEFPDERLRAGGRHHGDWTSRSTTLVVHRTSLCTR
jgi:hypothetical protein